MSRVHTVSKTESKSRSGNFRKAVALMLIVIMAVLWVSPMSSSITPSVYADEISGSDGETSSLENYGNMESSENSVASEVSGEVKDPEGSENSSGQVTLSNESQVSNPEESEEPSAPEVIKEFTVTYDLGKYGTKTEVVKENEFPKAVPGTSFVATTFEGWFLENGSAVDPATTAVTADVTYFARITRKVSDVLETVDHKPYVNGYNDGTVRPNNNITRSEAAAMFYGLLKNKNVERKNFPDVKSTKWYYDAVTTLGGLGVIAGYTDGSFGPDRTITRAEFVAMAVNFDMKSDNETSKFSDVTNKNNWAYKAITTAYAKGWIGGYKDGTFRPDAKITRAEAIAVINNMTGRRGDASYKTVTDTRNFSDLTRGYWAYMHILEASNEHTYHRASDGVSEIWDTYKKYSSIHKNKWVTVDGKKYYYNSSGYVLLGTNTIDGYKCELNSQTGALINGFIYEGKWLRYYRNGVRQDDISKLSLVSGSYYIEVLKPQNYLIIYAKDKKGDFVVPVKSMLVSCGNNTPTGTYYTPNRFRWLQMVGNTWSQWCTQIQGNYLFHSVPNWTYNHMDLEVDEYNHLGETRSLGCIRLNCENAKWIYDNCALGTKVYISTSKTAGVLGKPTGLKIPSWHTWDPTDPTAKYMCDKKGCKH